MIDAMQFMTSIGVPPWLAVAAVFGVLMDRRIVTIETKLGMREDA